MVERPLQGGVIGLGRRECEILSHRPADQGAALQQQRKMRPQRRFRPLRQGVPGDRDSPAAGRDQPRQQRQGGAFACPAGAGQRQCLARCDRQVEPGDHRARGTLAAIGQPLGKQPGPRHRHRRGRRDGQTGRGSRQIGRHPARRIRHPTQIGHRPAQRLHRLGQGERHQRCHRDRGRADGARRHAGHPQYQRPAHGNRRQRGQHQADGALDRVKPGAVGAAARIGGQHMRRLVGQPAGDREIAARAQQVDGAGAQRLQGALGTARRRGRGPRPQPQHRAAAQQIDPQNPQRDAGIDQPGDHGCGQKLGRQPRGQRQDQPQRHPVQRIDIGRQRIEREPAPHPFKPRKRRRGQPFEQVHPQRGQRAQRRVMGQQPLAIARRGATEGQKPYPGRGAEHVKDQAGTGGTRRGRRHDEPARKPQQRRPGGQHGKAEQRTADQRHPLLRQNMREHPPDRAHQAASDP
jgi:hypothetical protein